MRPEGGAAGDAHRASRAAAVPLRKPGSTLKAARETAVLPEHRHPKRERLNACCVRQLVDEALGEESELALRRAAHVAGLEREFRAHGFDLHIGDRIWRHGTVQRVPSKLVRRASRTE